MTPTFLVINFIDNYQNDRHRHQRSTTLFAKANVTIQRVAQHPSPAGEGRVRGNKNDFYLFVSPFPNPLHQERGRIFRNSLNSYKPIDPNNPAWQVEKAEDIINRAEKVFIADIVLAELKWILDGYFECSRKEIHTLLQSLAGNIKFCFEDWVAFNSALLDFSEHGNVELSDFLIARRAKNVGGHNTLYL